MFLSIQFEFHEFQLLNESYYFCFFFLQIFKKLFEDGLEIQKERLRELKSYAREQREKNEKRQQNEIESMEN